MIHVKNRKSIRHLAFKSLKSARTRNIIAVISIALTAFLFTTLFTISASLLYSFEQQTFRQVGGDFHGTFKNITKEQIDTLSDDSLIVNAGSRLLLGMPQHAPFDKTHVEISYMDEICAKGYFCEVTHGNRPVEGSMEIACDTRVLELLGIDPEIGTKVVFSYDIDFNSENPVTITDTFTLSGYWNYDPACPSSMVIIPLSYAQEVLANHMLAENSDVNVTWDLSVYLKSSAHIEKDLEQILSNHGYQNDDPSAANYINTGVNWAYLGAQLSSGEDATTTIAVLALALLIVFTGYLIIYNIFQISVSNDIRFYGTLKTIGTTAKQLRRIIILQALFLSAAGIPIGLVLGYFCGTILSPFIMGSVNSDITIYTPANPWVFIGAALFSLLTVFISCLKPGRKAGQVSPIEAVRYTEGQASIKTLKAHACTHTRMPLLHMAIANLKRNKLKTLLVLFSMSLAIVLLHITTLLTSGFDMDKYLRSFVVSDFILGDANYFKSDFHDIYALSEDDIQTVRAQGNVMDGGRIYGMNINDVYEHITEEQFTHHYQSWGIPKQDISYMLDQALYSDDGLIMEGSQLYGMEAFPLDHLTVIEGDLSALYNSDTPVIAAVYLTDDYDKPRFDSNWAHVGDDVTLSYVEEWEYYDTRNGKAISTEELENYPEEFWNIRPARTNTKEYEVVACVTIPNAMSYRRYGDEEFVINSERMIQDFGIANTMIYMYDTIDAEDDAMEAFLSDYTKNGNSALDYESKKTYQNEFQSFRSMFLLIGGLLSGIVGLVGILNFLNAVLTSIMTRRREFAMLQSIGMTGSQLKKMLIIEGILYAFMATLLSLLLSLLFSPVLKSLMNHMFWFITYRFHLYAILMVAPIFVLLGILLPLIAYRACAKQTIVERLRNID